MSMGTIEISDLLSYAVPLIVMYTAWIHTKVVSNEREIAVNSSKDESIDRQFEELKKDIKELTKEFHNFVMHQKGEK